MITNKSLVHLLDDKRILNNPHKGWYWHYIDNGMKNPRYGDRPEGYERFPGLNHLYLRVDWSDIEAERGVFDWSALDRIMDEWGARGYRFSLRVCCSETAPEMCFATPRWLYELGCPGAFYPPFPDKDPAWWELTHIKYKFRPDGDAAYYKSICEQYWEPDYFHPLFLEHLEAFIRAYAEKYDGDERIEYVDVGSYGNWGEGHTSAGSMRRGSFALFKKHIYLHKKYFKRTPLLVNDDYINQMEGNTHEDMLRPSAEKAALRDYCLSCGLGLRDDSILAGPDYHERAYHTVCTPELFDAFYPHAPIDVEAAHLTSYTAEDSRGGLVLLDALERTHATFAGFHAYIGDYLKDHAYLAEYIANRLGYWYFLDSVTYEDTPDADTAMRLTMTFENRGFGRCYRPYTLRVKLTPKAGGTPLLHTVEGFDNRPWERGTRYDVHTLVPLDGLRSGVYEVAVGMSEVLRDGHHPIELALSTGVCDADGFYTVGTVQIQEETL